MMDWSREIRGRIAECVSDMSTNDGSGKLCQSCAMFSMTCEDGDHCDGFVM